MSFRKQAIKYTATLATLLFSGFAFADPPDFSTLTTAVDFSTVITALLTIMAALAGVYIVMRGGSLILSKIRR